LTAKTLLLVAAILWTTGTASAEAPTVVDFKITEAAKRMLPLKKVRAPGETFVLKEHEPALLGPIAFRGFTALDAPLAVEIAGVRWTFEKAEPLIEMQSFSGGDVASLPAGTIAYCSLGSINPRKPNTAVPAAEMTLRKERFGKESSLCLVDVGNDGSFDKAFITGLRRVEDRHMAPVPSVPYTAVHDVQIPKSYVAVMFHHQNFMHSPRFYTEVVFLGKIIALQAMSMPDTDNAAAEFRPVSLTPDLSDGRLPLRVGFGPAAVTVLSIDHAAKTARVRMEQDWGSVPVNITQTVYR